ncbi:MAG: class I SAM-dependent methyltransferase, partial [Candidatus Eremiobacteraeota bacterium]|nr:class I SAM-dependent methyltransferase [Candidatus Eremiobacteraeota bacterium]
SNCTTLELGTGWFAVVPIGLFLCGAERVMTIDVTPLLRTENLVIAIRRFIDYDDRGRLSEFLPDVDARRISALRTLASGANGMSVDGMLKRLGIQYLVDDARRLALPDDCIDLIHSNDVFEHIYPDVLEDILREFKRVARPGGVMSHFIDMSDHLSHFDGSIDAYHFLRYSDAQWRFIDNTIAPQSRLRLNEYRAMYARLGIDVAEEKRWPGVLADVRERHLDSRFKTMPPAEVAVTHAYIISKLP